MPSAISSPITDHNGARLKRGFDLAAALLGLGLLAPLFAVIAAVVKLTSPGPVFYRAPRVGLGGALFGLYKFRSMHAEAPRLGPGITRAGDPRITPVGAWLRRYKLDELPQLINVVRGEMSLVGPRPEDPRYVARYSPEQRRVLTVRPGLTSVASVRYRHEEALLVGEDWEQTYLQVVMPDKLRLELAYLDGWNLSADWRVLWETAVALLR
jgi:lipopolysaccharide/colanic/teichoic acid biosynthesis glycosyltransferase